jgi:beta-phosphoglucomutase-like phosphatase (HAD superfamily)
MKLAVEECIVFEDSQSGVKAAKKAGMFCVGITNTQPVEKIKEADLVCGEINLKAIRDITVISDCLQKK